MDALRQEAAEALVMKWAAGVTRRPSLRELADLADQIVAAPGPSLKVVPALLPAPAKISRKTSRPKPGAKARPDAAVDGKCHGRPGCERPIRYKKAGLCAHCYQAAWQATHPKRSARRRAVAAKAPEDAEAEPRRNPQKLPEGVKPEAIAAHRDLTCGHLQKCLMLASKKNWAGLSCGACALAKLEANRITEADSARLRGGRG